MRSGIKIKVVKHRYGIRTHLAGEIGSRGGKKTLCGRRYSNLCRYGYVHHIEEETLSYPKGISRRDFCPTCKELMKGKA